MTDPMIQMSIDDHIRAALSEDLPFGDVSTQAVMPEPRDGHVDLIAKQDGVIAGLSVFARVFELLDPLTVTISHVSDGDEVSRGKPARRKPALPLSSISRSVSSRNAARCSGRALLPSAGSSRIQLSVMAGADAMWST